MDRFRRTSSPVGSGRPLVIGGDKDRSFGRKSLRFGRAAESFQHKLIASFRSVRRSGLGEELAQNGSRLYRALLLLPNELLVQILCELFIADILALRRASRALNELVTACGPALVRFWVKHKMGSLHTKLYPPPRTNEAHLQYLLAMRRRHIASIRLTRELATFVLKDTLRHTNQRQKEMWASVYEKMIPLVFGVGYFLEEHRRILLERDLGRIRPRSHIGYDICTTPGITSQERKILKSLDPPLRLQCFYMYCFILQVLMRKLRPPTYAGSVEKVLRGWHGKPACVEDIAFVLILGGVGAVAKLLACENYSERRRLLHSFITRLSPHENVRWREHWRDLGVTSHALLDDIPCSSIGITQLDQIWTPVIVEGMSAQSMEFTPYDKDRYEEVVASRSFLNELMGYDILRGRPPDEDDSDDGGGDDM
ncbi:uncharacterized protein CC84DRAFT_1166481 [Paraphaeosphaeria sporulosa]|uniref:F-box domain-containing protein n=1 Tax=Paraphaeosphaeria sporulosa TaxID=1460663 RepID=A0A177C554_9PLEO|nr:uncharacterized protein CC84DRAFT_1166481 [Paraphaeosphaeria sporulosa]OAG02645.1 hypothetical protein CC84DRAFT_1166481 [Paraphaeosphaeria sporulosa]